jgi:hypothetical protein
MVEKMVCMKAQTRVVTMGFLKAEKMVELKGI